MKNSLKALTLVASGFSSLAQGQTTVYQDNFDGDGINTNSGVGGGGVAIRYRSTTAFEWNDNDPASNGLEAGATGIGNQITTFHSEESFNVSDGFTLEVAFIVPSTGTSPTPANHLSFGLTTAVAVDATDSTVPSEFLSSSGFTPTADAIGFSLGPRNNNVDEGLIAWDADGNGGTGLFSALAAITFDEDTAGAGQTITLEVDGDGNYTYTYNSLTAGVVTGTGVTSIDLDQTYHFRARTQGSSGNAIQSILLTTASAQFDPPTIGASASVYDQGAPVDFNVTFDPSAESLTLVTPSGNVDLLAIDLNDGAPGDGLVVYTESPSLGINAYEVTATRTGVADLSASTELLVIDPSTEAPDNAFSSAIKADSPLFYYRFEDLMDSNSQAAPETIFIRDSSGNDYHVGDDGIQGGISVTAGPAGMQNAANFTPVNGARGILSPATSQLSESYTFVSVLNVTPRSTGNPRHLLSMASETLGGTTGGQVIQWLSNFRTSLGGGIQSLTDADALMPNTSCLLHAVFTADDVNGGGEIALYLNGEAIGTPVTLATIPDNNGNWIIGATDIFQDPSWFDFIDETAIFETALTDAQIEAHATAFFTAADPFLGFDSNATEIVFGEDIELTWKVSDAITAITINGNPVAGDAVGGVYTQTFTPTDDTTYTIEVTGPGGPFTSSIDVTVDTTNAPTTVPEIVSISLSNSNPPNVTLELAGGSPNGVFFIFGSTNLADDFPFEMADEITLDAQGEASVTFTSFQNVRFFRATFPPE